MKWSATSCALVLAGLFLAGCEGTTFVRVQDEALVLGQTTQEEITARLGRPYGEMVETRNDKLVKRLGYFYGNTAGGLAATEDGVAARAQEFYFFNGKLVG